MEVLYPECVVYKTEFEVAEISWLVPKTSLRLVMWQLVYMTNNNNNNKYNYNNDDDNDDNVNSFVRWTLSLVKLVEMHPKKSSWS